MYMNISYRCAAFKKTIHDVLKNDISEEPRKFWSYGELELPNESEWKVDGLGSPLKFPVSSEQAKDLYEVRC